LGNIHVVVAPLFSADTPHLENNEIIWRAYIFFGGKNV
jgi:hypothetical protein